MYIVAIGLVVGALASWVNDDLINTGHFQSASALDYAATAATDVAIADIRYTPYEASTAPGPGNCFNAPAGANTSGLWSSNSSMGYTMAVWCSTTQTVPAQITREVTFYTCEESTLELSSPNTAAQDCEASPFLFAEVGFDDNPPNGYLTSTCYDSCGETADVQKWIWGGAATSATPDGPGAPSSVVFTTEPPATTTAGATLASFSVSIVDTNGNVETTGNTGATDTIALTSSCTLGGTDSVVAADGVATFSAVTITAGTSCTLTATDSSETLATGTSTSVTL
ncbi:MAG: hypothetical protein ACRDVC_08790 [Acidimicrobiales bacterium]